MYHQNSNTCGFILKIISLLNITLNKWLIYIYIYFFRRHSTFQISQNLYSFFWLEVVPFLFYAHASSKKINPPFPADKKSFHPGLELGDDNLRHHFRSFGSMLHIGRNHLSSILGDLENFCWENTKLARNFVAIFLRIFFLRWGGVGRKKKRWKRQSRFVEGQKMGKSLIWCVFFSHVFCWDILPIYRQSNMEDELSPWKKNPCWLKKDIQITEFPFLVVPPFYSYRMDGPRGPMKL